MADAPTISRRERLRQETLAEIKRRALDQIADGGTPALSLNAIAKAMGMSGPAIYRYFASRDDLLTALVHDGYVALTAVLLEAGAPAPERTTPAERLQATAAAYRAWAREHQHHYGMLFGARPEGFHDPEEAISILDGSMVVILELLGALAGEHPTAPPDPLDAELEGWAALRGLPDGSTLILRLGLLTWTRLHGVVGLELAGVFADMGIDAGLLADAEIEQVIATARAARASG